jgi:DNA repair protein RadC
MTKAIIDIATPLGISVHDHIIVGKGGHASLREARAAASKAGKRFQPAIH